MNHPSDRELELYVMGASDDASAIESHLAECATCSQKVAAEAEFELDLRNTADQIVFCCACEQVLAADSDRCSHCGAAVRAGGFAIDDVLVSHARGRLYVARDADGKRVALKELAFVQAPGVEAIAAFEREAKFLRALEHPAIPRFVASFQEGEGVDTRLYLAQDFIDGPSLESRLRDHWFDEAECRDILRQVIDILVYLQGLSPAVIHRDIKPANLLQRDDGTIALVDFGAAYDQGATVGSTMAGTFGYMPVEQMAGQVDSSTDLYALGASVLHLLTRREPWKLLEASEPVSANISAPMGRFLGKLTARDREERFASALEARAALERLEAGEDTSDGDAAKPLAAAPKRFARVRRGLKFVALGAAAVVATSAAVATIESAHDDDHPISGEQALLCDAYAERYIALVESAASAARGGGITDDTRPTGPLSRWHYALRTECINAGGVSPAVLSCAYGADNFGALVDCMPADKRGLRGVHIDELGRLERQLQSEVARGLDAALPPIAVEPLVVTPNAWSFGPGGARHVTVHETADGKTIVLEENGATTVIESDGTVTRTDAQGTTTVLEKRQVEGDRDDRE